MLIPPTRLVALIHPAPMFRIVSHLNYQAMSRLKFYTQYSLISGSIPLQWYPTVKRGIIDSHFHLDKFFCRRNHSLSDLEGSKSIPIRITFAIANYVIPSRWHLLSEQVRADPRIRITPGVHPHLITESQVESLFSQLKRLVDKYQEAVCIWEVGWIWLRSVAMVAIIENTANPLGFPRVGFETILVAVMLCPRLTLTLEE